MSLSNDYARLERACRRVEHRMGWPADRGRFDIEIVNNAVELRLGARIAAITAQDIPEDISRELSAVSKAVAQLQTDMIRGDIDACESDT